MFSLPIEFLYTAFKLKVSFLKGTDSTDVEGTGFFVMFKQNFYLVTNRHVIDLQWKHPNSPQNKQKFLGYRLASITCSGRMSGDAIRVFVIIQPQIIYSKNYTDDVILIKMGSILGIDKIPEPPVLNHYISFDDIAKESQFDGQVNGITACDQIAFPIHTHEFSSTLDRPIFRMGWIVSDPRYDLELEDVSGEAFLMDAFSTSGASGAPIFALQKGTSIAAGKGIALSGGIYRSACLIGINAGHIKSPNFGHANLSYAFKSSIIVNCLESQEKMG
ncbi:MAG: hypothetical protein KGQ79_09330 [Proteobacteria bacterium]|nr:hypothetical protein [Pseudomonadota bacterium]